MTGPHGRSLLRRAGQRPVHRRSRQYSLGLHRYRLRPVHGRRFLRRVLLTVHRVWVFLVMSTGRNEADMAVF